MRMRQIIIIKSLQSVQSYAEVAMANRDVHHASGQCNHFFFPKMPFECSNPVYFFDCKQQTLLMLSLYNPLVFILFICYMLELRSAAGILAPGAVASLSGGKATVTILQDSFAVQMKCVQLQLLIKRG